MASRNALAADFRRIISRMEEGHIKTSPWITHRAPIEAVPEVFSSWTKPETGVIKALIEVLP
jgi:alcohol dehydrogenase